jgi:triosephosphate isomerase
MNERYVVANWKLNPVKWKDAKGNLTTLQKKLSKSKIKRTKILIAPPAIYFRDILDLSISKFDLCAQDVYFENSGPHTGRISAQMFSEYKAKYAIVGHSDMREAGDTLEVVNKKILSCLKIGIVPIVCIGEKEKDNNGFYLKKISDQITTALAGVSKKDIANVILTYEPVWAISNKEQREATAEEVAEAVIFIRRIISDMYDEKIARMMPILYGGSVDDGDAPRFVENTDVVGFLVGRASLDPEKFSKIIQETDSAKRPNENN